MALMGLVLSMLPIYFNVLERMTVLGITCYDDNAICEMRIYAKSTELRRSLDGIR